MTLNNMETVISNALRRSIRLGEPEVVPRVTDLMHLLSTMKGKVEWNFAEDHEEDRKIAELIRDAIAIVFRRRCGSGVFAAFLQEFTAGQQCEISEMTPAEAYRQIIERYPALKKQVAALAAEETPGSAAAAVEFILEGLAISGRLTKKIHERRVSYGQGT
ncbi:MAG: hypothetical protein GY868_14420 [Deltaproteobacteria bacterium]|nr:hypothetical protein [Deltaproteobacteria bacterium]